MTGVNLHHQPGVNLNHQLGVNLNRQKGVNFIIFCTTGERSLEMSSTEELPVNSASGQIDLSIQKDVLGEQHKAYFMGVEFAQLVNGQHYNINNGIHNAAAIIMTENT